MRKLLLTAIAVLAMGAAAQAQVFVAGVKAGASSSKIQLSDIQNDPLQYIEADNITGYHIGAFTRLQLLGLVFQPEATLSTSGGKVEVTDNTNSTNVRIDKFRFNRLDVPLLVGYNFLKIARVQAGPLASTIITAKQEGQDIKDYYEKTDWGYQAGLGIDIGNLTLDIRYERIKRNYTNTVLQSEGELRNEQFLVSLGLKLIK